jgi:hypothetical protein
VAALQGRSDAGEFRTLTYVDVAIRRVVRPGPEETALVERLIYLLGGKWEADARGVWDDETHHMSSRVRLWYVGTNGSDVDALQRANSDRSYLALGYADVAVARVEPGVAGAVGARLVATLGYSFGEPLWQFDAGYGARDEATTPPSSTVRLWSNLKAWGTSWGAVDALRKRSDDREFLTLTYVDVEIALLSKADADANEWVTQRLREKLGTDDWKADATEGVREAGDGVSSRVLMWYTGKDAAAVAAAVAGVQKRSNDGEFLACRWAYVDVVIERDFGDPDTDEAVADLLLKKLGLDWKWDSDAQMGVLRSDESKYRMRYPGRDWKPVAAVWRLNDAGEFKNLASAAGYDTDSPSRA